MSGAAVSALAQNGPAQGGNGNGKGYGGPPQSQEERAARQAACLEKNDGVCPNGGPQENCQGQGKSQCRGKGQGQCNGKGSGYGHRNGLRDGTGPRSVNGTCPNTNAPAQLKK